MSSASTLPGPDQDMHVHSTFSDGEGTIGENVAEAERLGLSRLRCVDHVRADSAWASEFVRTVREVAAETEVSLSCGLEAKILDKGGALDLPDDTGGADFIYAADHQVALDHGPEQPASVREAIAAGELDAGAVIESIVDSTANAVGANHRVVIAHLFSVLPKIGLDEQQVPLGSVERLAQATAKGEGLVEIDERWSCPSARTLRPFRDAGVPILLSSDSHRPGTIGRFDYCLEVLEELED
jgi:putative hydrolase